MSLSMKKTRSNIWNCGGKDWKEKGTGCGQKISKIENRSDRRFGRIVNEENGPGGGWNEDHICPQRLRTGALSSGYKKRMNMSFMCHRCLKTFKGIFVDCPFCFKLICQACGHQQDYRIDRPENRCNKCGHRYLDFTEVTIFVPLPSSKWVDWVERIKDENHGDYIMTGTATGACRKKTEEELNWHPVIAQRGVKQIFDCNRYGHITQPGDKNCRVCGVGLIRP